MADVLQAPEQAVGDETIVNDFQIIVATVNGTGSQTSNSLVIRSLFRMGIPVNGKNIFPSNIKGLQTWYTIRVSKDGYVARKEENQVLVAMNKSTIIEDIKQLPAGGVCLYDSGIRYEPTRDDILTYAMPVDDIMDQTDVKRSLRERVRNMVYVGALASLIGIELAEIEASLNAEFPGKQKVVDLNMSVIKLGHAYAEENYDRPSPFRVERMDETKGKLLMEGNAAAALGATFGGVQMLSWYPITPSSSVADNAMKYLSKFRIDKETGKASYAIIQAEDELAAIGMVLGAGWAGARAMTATSGPGISLMSEFAGMAYFAEIPSVIWNIQRVGPSTGLPTRTSQGDLLASYMLGHGDTQHICLLPANLKEAFEFGWRAFDIAERFQTLVFVLSDLDLGMNLWMTEPFDYPDEPMDRGKVLNAEQLNEHIKEYKRWGRYHDVDGDGIGYRALPGTPHPQAAYFTRGTGHDEWAVYSENSDVWVENLTRLTNKIAGSRDKLPQPIVETVDAADFGVIAFGTVDPAVVEARDRLAAHDKTFDYMRVRALPLSPAVREFIEAHDTVYVVENNFDGQLAKIIIMDYPELATRLKSIAYLDGLPFTAKFIVDSIMEHE
ncbi:MAG: 2-oxoacid:acceptor oxidoreductase subunit alpha [Chloroflexi bacterium]|nr:2-oxoacid:acceptor oxidoreductase subunit alpha [Chloroflexota bacterium]